MMKPIFLFFFLGGLFFSIESQGMVLVGPVCLCPSPSGLSPCPYSFPNPLGPCDNACAGQALKDMGKGVKDGLSKLKDAYEDLSDAIEKSGDKMADLGVNVGNSLTTSTDAFLGALSASSKKKEVTIKKATKMLEAQQDAMTNTFVNTLKGIRVARGVAENEKTLGCAAQPESGDCGVDQAKDIKAFEEQTEQVSAASTAGFIDYVGDKNGMMTAGGEGQHYAQALLKVKEFDKLYLMLHETTMKAADFADIQQLAGLAVAPSPLPKAQDGENLEYELARKRYVSMTAMAYNSLISPAIVRMGIQEEGCADVHENGAPNDEGKISEKGYQEANVNGKVADPDWWGDVLMLNETGLNREKAYQEATASVLKARLNQLSEDSGNLLAIVLIKKIENSSAAGEIKFARRTL